MSPQKSEEGVDDEQVAAWAKEFDVTETQIREAIAEVGTNPSDLEMHLKGSRSSTNSDKVHAAGTGSTG